MKKDKLFYTVIVFIFVIAGLILVFSSFNLFKRKPEKFLLPTRIYTFYGFRLPFQLSEKEVTDSLMKGTSIMIKDKIELGIVSLIERMALEDGWQLLERSFYTDGGSKRDQYFKNKDNPAIDLFYKWNMLKGKWEGVKIEFIHPDRLGSWLLKIQTYKALKGSSLDVEALMECEGKIVETRPELEETECLK